MRIYMKNMGFVRSRDKRLFMFFLTWPAWKDINLDWLLSAAQFQLVRDDFWVKDG